MAYHAAKSGPDRFTPRKVQTDKICFVCEETIPAYTSAYIESNG